MNDIHGILKRITKCHSKARLRNFQLSKDGRYRQIFGVSIVSFLADLSYETNQIDYEKQVKQVHFSWILWRW